MNVNEAIKKLQNDPDIILTGPDCSDPNKLRVYANGGLIGKIYIGNQPKGSTNLINPKYYIHFEILKDIIENSKTPLETIVKEEYILACKQAIEKRFGKKKKDSSEKGEKERHVQTRIVKRFMGKCSDWCIADMEMQCPKSWFKGNKFSINTTKQPRFDMIVLNHDGVGIIELKVNNDNTDNMESHYEHMSYLLTNNEAQKTFLSEINRRVGILCDKGLLDKDVLEFPRNKLWCGFLFVGGEIRDTKDIVKKLNNKKDADKIKLLYYPSFDVERIDINKAVSYREFINKY